MMQGVITVGTATRPDAQLGPPAAGKTGTTDGFTDAWFIGLTPSLACGVWVGYDVKRSRSARASRAAGRAADLDRLMMRGRSRAPRRGFPATRRRGIREHRQARPACSRPTAARTPSSRPSAAARRRSPTVHRAITRSVHCPTTCRRSTCQAGRCRRPRIRGFTDRGRPLARPSRRPRRSSKASQSLSRNSSLVTFSPLFRLVP